MAELNLIEVAQRLNIEGINAEWLGRAMKTSLADQPSSSIRSAAEKLAQSIIAAFSDKIPLQAPQLADALANPLFLNLLIHMLENQPNAANMINLLGANAKLVAEALTKMLKPENVSKVSRGSPKESAAVATRSSGSEIDHVFARLHQRGFFRFDQAPGKGQNIKSAVEEAKAGYVRKDNLPKFT
jgi:hypothetical protein